MLSEQLPKQIELLVDSLRKQNQAQVSLTDVASVTEVLIATMQAFFRSIDTSIYRECRALSDYITNARKEIASLQPGDLEETRIPRAGLELDAIVQHTEEATNTIMTAAEEIMALDPSDTQLFQETVQNNVLKIFEACSFQDITGQRISKVIETLSHIEDRVGDLRDLLGVTEEDIEEAKAAAGAEDVDENKSLLNGPALDGEGIDQSAVDALMDKGGAGAPAAADSAPSTPAAKPAKAAPPAPKPVDPGVLDSMFEEDFEVEIDDDKQKEEDKDAANLQEKEEVSQDDIDALFN